MKKSLITILVLAMTVLPLAAEDYSTLMFKAREQSRTLENAELTYRNQKMSHEKKEELGVTVNFQVTPVSSMQGVPGMPGVAPAADQFSVDRLSAQFTLPNDGNTSITVASPMTFGYDGRFSMNPSVSASHTFSLSPERDTRTEDIEDTIQDLNTSKTRALADFSFDRSVINLMKQILQNERSMLNQEYTVLKQQRSLDEQVALGKVEEDSIQWQRTHMNIEKAERSLDNMRKQHESLLDKFTSLTGEVWSGIENIPTYSLKVDRLPSGNTDVIIASLRKDQAELRLERYGVEEISRSLSVSGDLSGGMKHQAGAAGVDGRIDTSLSVGYQDPTWKANAKISFGGTDWSDMRPTITVGGSWSTGPKAKLGEKDMSGLGGATKERAELENELVQKTNSYTDAVVKYEESIHDLEKRVEDHLWEVRDHQNQMEYLSTELEFERALFEEGLSTERAIEDAEHDLEMERLGGDMLKLDGVLLAYDIAQNAL